MSDPLPSYHEFPILGRAYFLGGRASTSVRRVLANAHIDPDIISRVSVACYEGEMNVVLHAASGHVELELQEDRIVVAIQDHGPGIEDVELAMTPGWSSATEEARALGFGAGMGLPNMKQQVDDMQVHSSPGEGVRVEMTFLLPTGEGDPTDDSSSDD
jgi:anti-sigma regulatory factor (Ser/Thr protein kinase)